MQSADCQHLKTREQRDVREMIDKVRFAMVGLFYPTLNVPTMRKDAGRRLERFRRLYLVPTSYQASRRLAHHDAAARILLHRPDNTLRQRQRRLARARSTVICAALSYGALHACVASSSLRCPRSHNGALSLRRQRGAPGAWHSPIFI